MSGLPPPPLSKQLPPPLAQTAGSPPSPKTVGPPPLGSPQKLPPPLAAGSPTSAAVRRQRRLSAGAHSGTTLQGAKVLPPPRKVSGSALPLVKPPMASKEAMGERSKSPPGAHVVSRSNSQPRVGLSGLVPPKQFRKAADSPPPLSGAGPSVDAPPVPAPGAGGEVARLPSGPSLAELPIPPPLAVRPGPPSPLASTVGAPTPEPLAASGGLASESPVDEEASRRYAMFAFNVGISNIALPLPSVAVALTARQRVGSGLDKLEKIVSKLESESASRKSPAESHVLSTFRASVDTFLQTISRESGIDASAASGESSGDFQLAGFKALLPCVTAVAELADSLKEAAETLTSYDSVSVGDWSEEQKNQHLLLKKFMDDESDFVMSLMKLARVRSIASRSHRIQAATDAVQMYESPIRGENLLAEADCSQIFWKIDALLSLHKELLLSLRQAYDNFPSPVGKIMKDTLPKMKVYSAFLGNMNTAQETLARCMKDHSKFAKFVRNTDKEQGGALDFRLREPSKKLNQYMLFIETYYNQTPPHALAERRCLEEAADIVEELLDQTSEKENLADNLQKVMEIGDAVEGLNENLVLPDRRFIHEGVLKTIPGDSSKPIADYCILFNDMMLCVHAKSVKDRKFVFGMKIWMHQVTLKAEPEGSKGNNLQIVVQPTPEKKSEYTLVAANKQEAENWTLKFGDVARDVKRYRKVFGVPLQVLLKREQDSDIPSIVEKSIKFIREYGLELEGIFRLSGRASQVEKLRDQLDQGKKVFFSADMDVHSVASLFKQWLRELPEPLLTWDLYDEFIATDALGDAEKLVALKDLTLRLPEGNRYAFQHMVKLLTEVCANEAKTKLNASTLSVVFAPNVLVDPKGPMFDASAYVAINNVAKEFIEHYDFILGWVEKERSATANIELRGTSGGLKKKKATKRASVRLSTQSIATASCPNLLLINTKLNSPLLFLDKKKWVDRFMVLRGSQLMMLKTQSDKKPKAKYPLTAESRAFFTPNAGKPNAFTFERNKKECLQLAASSQELAQEWIDAINASAAKA